MDNRSLARVLNEIADVLEIKAENVFRIRSYRLAGEALASFGEEAADLLRRGEPLARIPNVGQGIAAKLKELLETGSCAYHRELLDEVPAGLLELLRIPGLGPKGVSLVWRQLGVRSADDLLAAIDDGRFRTLPGMKEKKEARIRKGLEDRRRAQQRFLRPEADAAVARLDAYLRQHGARDVQPVGSYRRQRESIGDLDLIVVGEAAALSDALAQHPDVREVLGAGGAKTTVVLGSGLQVDMRPFDAASLGAALQYFTGSKSHNVALRERAVRRGLKLNEYGVFRVDTGEKLAGAAEAEVYGALGLAWIPPELREDRGEIEAAEAGGLPLLLEAADLQGDLHAHTTESDGKHGLEDMARAARERGLRYLAVTDHSRAIPSAAHRTGMDEARCIEHIARIRACQERLPGFRLLAGIEVDILADGRLDMADDVLARLDVVVAALHSRLEMPAEAMTERVLAAFDNPYFQVWAHPLSRRIGRRDPVALDWERVVDAAARRGIAFEINSQPARLDLPDHLLRSTRERGIRFVISSDSHATGHFANLDYGVGQARRGWLRREDVLNTRDADGLLRALRAPGQKPPLDPVS